MQLAFLGLLAFWAGIARAHFRLLYPAPRGVFVSDSEPNFCGEYLVAVHDSFGNTAHFYPGGYTNAVSNRTGVLLSTAQNPTSFDNFTSNGEQQLVRPWAREANGGTFCIPLPLNSTGIAGVEDRANVTIQIVLDGSDGSLYQCADLTLSSSYEIPSNVTCSNTTTTTTTTTSTTGSASSTTTSAASQSTDSSALGMAITPIYTAVTVLAAAILTFI
ncbi:hypothetical protein EDD18DRAFT_1325345 [Armillaria luteobubalina]|uniref:Copper acquisition factor BIM1-like domain-containing protein n=1 Tax=Armillaria luteobubalina TaxID=153913 RepID=A0AA39U1J7_9AGAR|nr:hypothetical protein EDD18DRAFT_1325345 [Armillaria luteobubalina]